MGSHARWSRPRSISAAVWIFACTVLAAAACRSGAAGPTVVMDTKDGEVAVRVEVARSREELSRGLMWRDRLDSDAGMLFVFGDETVRTFWMKNTPLPLDIIFIDAGGRVVNVAQATTPYSESPIRSAGPARYVLEVNAGFARRHGIGPGSRVTLPAE